MNSVRTHLNQLIHEQYVGRWVPTLNRLRRDASFPGQHDV